ncbi:MAG: porin family protein [Ignavibacteriales bacterium]|nr:porin family protein [Ignavibacteriales bacterium]
MIRSIKYLLTAILFFLQLTIAEKPPSSKATGFFVAFGVGPRMPIGDFSSTTDIGYGVNVEFSYTDTDFLPVFLFANVGYEQYPGSQNYLQETEYSNFHTNALPVNVGARYYFAPLLENIVLLMPIVQASATYTYYQTLNEFDENSGRNNFLDDESKFGFSAGAGVSMFMMELLATYNYMPSNQFISVDLKVRIPLYISF